MSSSYETFLVSPNAIVASCVVVGSSVVFMRMFEMLDDAPILADYADRCLARPAYNKAMSLEPK